MEFLNVAATLNDYVVFLEVFQFPNLQNYVSFEPSGIYDAAFLAARNSYIFSREKYRSAQVGITNTITNYANKWKSCIRFY